MLKQATLHQLKVFEAIAGSSSFTSRRGSVSQQPTVSAQQIKQLTKSGGAIIYLNK